MFQGCRAVWPFLSCRKVRAWAMMGRVASSRGANFSNSSLLLKPSAVFTCTHQSPIHTDPTVQAQISYIIWLCACLQVGRRTSYLSGRASDEWKARHSIVGLVLQLGLGKHHAHSIHAAAVTTKLILGKDGYCTGSIV